MKLDQEAITTSTARAALAAGLAAIDAGDLSFDLSSVKRCDTSAIACVLAWTRAAGASGRKLAWIGVPDDLRSLGRLYRVDALFEG